MGTRAVVRPIKPNGWREHIAALRADGIRVAHVYLRITVKLAELAVLVWHRGFAKRDAAMSYGSSLGLAPAQLLLRVVGVVPGFEQLAPRSCDVAVVHELVGYLQATNGVGDILGDPTAREFLLCQLMLLFKGTVVPKITSLGADSLKRSLLPSAPRLCWHGVAPDPGR